MDSDSLLLRVLEWAWLSLIAVILHIYRKLTGLDTQAQLLDQQAEHHEKLRKEEKDLRNDQRKEILDKIDSHHKTVMTKLDNVEMGIKKNGKS